MTLTSSWSSDEQRRDDDEQDDTQKLHVSSGSRQTRTLARKFSKVTDTTEMQNVSSKESVGTIDTTKTPGIVEESSTTRFRAQRIEIPTSLSYASYVETIDTDKAPRMPQAGSVSSQSSPTKRPGQITREYAILLIALLCIVVFQAINIGSAQFLGARGWAYVLGGPANAGDPNLLKGMGKQLSLTPGSAAQAARHLTPQQYIDLIVGRMTLDQKLGQMMIVQFTGPTYSLDLSTMINQYGVGAVLIFAANQNIESRDQLKGLIKQMQSSSPVPLTVAIDQEGGYVDRLAKLDGPRPAVSVIGTTNDPNQAMAAGTQDAQDLTYYGINLNLAPVVDVTNVYNPQLDHRTYGNTATLVTKMAGAYLQGLQKSGKVLGTLKHFPGLGDVGTDPHSGVPYLSRSQSDLEQIDWAPYRALIQQGNVHSIMVTHEIVKALDSSKPSSLSYKVVTGILRNELGFQGVIMTDSLTMEGISAYYNEAQAAALSVEAGSDLLMGADTPSRVATMIEGIKQAVNDGTISQQRIDDSVHRILMMKYEMGLLPIPAN